MSIIESKCNPDGPCQDARNHTSLDCYPNYLSLEIDGTDHEVMTYAEWSLVFEREI